VIAAGKKNTAHAETRGGWRGFLTGGQISLLISSFMGMSGRVRILRGGKNG